LNEDTSKQSFRVTLSLLDAAPFDQDFIFHDASTESWQASEFTAWFQTYPSEVEGLSLVVDDCNGNPMVDKVDGNLWAPHTSSWSLADSVNGCLTDEICDVQRCVHVESEQSSTVEFKWGVSFAANVETSDG
jgi:hypothetical protein